MALLSLSFSLIIACSGESPESRAALLERASANFTAGEYRAAEIDLKALLQDEPGNTDARILLGKIYLQREQGAAAEGEFERAARSLEQRGPLLPLTARALLLQGKYAEAAELDDFSQELAPADQADLLASRGLAMTYLGDINRAAVLTEAALELRPADAYANYARTMFLLATGKVEQAEIELDELAAAHPEFGQVWALKGDLSASKSQLKAAEAHYGKAIETKTSNLVERLKRARSRILLEDYEGASADLQIARKMVGPESPELNYLRGLMAYQQEDLEEAKKFFDRALQANPEHRAAAFYLGTIHYKNGEYPLAERWLKLYLSDFPDYAPANRMMAAMLLAQGKGEVAEQFARAALKAGDEDVLSMTLLAGTLFAQGEIADGRAAYEELVKLQPESASALTDLGLALVREGRAAEGITQLEKALQLEPEFKLANEQLIVSHVENKDYAKALEVALDYRQKNPKLASAGILLGVVYLGMGDVDSAEEAFVAVDSDDGGNISANSGLAAIALRRGNFEGASTFYQRALAVHPADTPTAINLAAVQQAVGDTEGMKNTLLAAIEARPEALRPRVLLSGYYLRNDGAALVEELLEPVKADHPENIQLLSLLSEAQIRTGKFDVAVVNLEQIIELEPGSANAHYALSVAYERVSRFELMETELEEALRLDATHRDALAALAKLNLARGDAAAARQHIDSLATQVGSRPDILNFEGQLAELENQPERALTLYRASFAAAANNFTLARLANNLEAQGEIQEAIDLLADWLESYPDDSLTWFELGRLYLLSGQLDKAKLAYEEVVRVAPGNSIALNNIAWALHEKDPEQAIVFAEQALAISPGSAEFIDTYAMALRNSGDLKGAMEQITQSVEMVPENPDYRYHKALIASESGDVSGALAELDYILGKPAEFPEREEAEKLKKKLGG